MKFIAAHFLYLILRPINIDFIIVYSSLYRSVHVILYCRIMHNYIKHIKIKTNIN